MKQWVLPIVAFAAVSLHASESEWPEYLPKLEVLCDAKFSSDYDMESLKKHNIEIARGQTEGANECNEPLRYVWYLCRTEDGKKIVKKNIKGFRCVGTDNNVGDLKMRSGIVTVSRANEERQAYLRSKSQFENLLKVKLTLKNADPYSDAEWRDLRFQPNPVVSTKTYCTVDGKKIEFDSDLADDYVRRKQSAKIACKFEGEDWTDLIVKDGKKTGFSKNRRDNFVRTERFKDGILDGEEVVTQNGKPSRIVFRSQGQVVWTKEFHPSGRMASYSVDYKHRRAGIEWNQNGKITDLKCAPDARKDELLRAPCGFNGRSEVKLLDVNGDVSSIHIYEGGELKSQRGGDSKYGVRSTVQYVDGKKQGREEVTDNKGRKIGSIEWRKGIKHGEEIEYFTEVDTVRKRDLWDEGRLTKRTLYFMNGEMSSVETYEGPDRYTREDFTDDGRKYSVLRFKRCRKNSYWPWCLDGGQERFITGGGRREEFYKDGTPIRSKHWNEDGTLEWDRELMPDGSEKKAKSGGK